MDFIESEDGQIHQWSASLMLWLEVFGISIQESGPCRTTSGDREHSLCTFQEQMGSTKYFPLILS
jgi:hypothetical protein